MGFLLLSMGTVAAAACAPAATAARPVFPLFDFAFLHRLICILNVEIHPDSHDNQRCPENFPRHLAEYQERQQNSHKRRNCIIGTRPGRSDLTLRENVKIYAEADRQETQDHDSQRSRYPHRAFVNDERNQQ